MPAEINANDKKFLLELIALYLEQENNQPSDKFWDIYQRANEAGLIPLETPVEYSSAGQVWYEKQKQSPAFTAVDLIAAWGINVLKKEPPRDFDHLFAIIEEVKDYFSDTVNSKIQYCEERVCTSTHATIEGALSVLAGRSDESLNANIISEAKKTVVAAMQRHAFGQFPSVNAEAMVAKAVDGVFATINIADLRADYSACREITNSTVDALADKVQGFNNALVTKISEIIGVAFCQALPLGKIGEFINNPEEEPDFSANESKELLQSVMLRWSDPTVLANAIAQETNPKSSSDAIDRSSTIALHVIQAQYANDIVQPQQEEFISLRYPGQEMDAVRAELRAQARAQMQSEDQPHPTQAPTVRMQFNDTVAGVAGKVQGQQVIITEDGTTITNNFGENSGTGGATIGNFANVVRGNAKQSRKGFTQDAAGDVVAGDIINGDKVGGTDQGKGTKYNIKANTVIHQYGTGKNIDGDQVGGTDYTQQSDQQDVDITTIRQNGQTIRIIRKRKL